MTPGAKLGAEDLPAALQAAGRDADPAATLDAARRAFEREFLTAKLRENGFSVSRTAEAVGLARETLSRKIRSLGIEVERD
jgi:DNA-binding NtrC family response regulator